VRLGSASLARARLIDFTVPLFGGYLRRQYPLSSFEDE
jgi:hypothetical protein